QPGLAQRWALSDLVGLGRRAVSGLRAVVVAVIPPAVGYLVLAGPIATLVLANGAGGRSGAQETAGVLIALTVGLPGFCAYLFLTSVFQAMQDTRTVFFLYLVENGLNVALAYTLDPFLGVTGLGLALSIAYTVAAVIAGVVLSGRLNSRPDGARPDGAHVSDTGRLYLAVPEPGRSALASLAAAGGYPGEVRRPASEQVGLVRALVRVCALSLVMAAAVAAVSHGIGSDHGVGLVVRVFVAVAVGVSVFAGGAVVASRLGSGPRGRRRDS
ncbi:MAG: lipid II flippase MurJ, partial [Acidimicrobiales bacterium]